LKSASIQEAKKSDTVSDVNSNVLPFNKNKVLDGSSSCEDQKGIKEMQLFDYKNRSQFSGNQMSNFERM
jgi:hypothetical protein